jgi:hypothetical protein
MTTKDDSVYAVVEIEKDDSFDTVDIVISITDLNVERYEEVILDIARVFKNLDIKMIKG